MGRLRVRFEGEEPRAGAWLASIAAAAPPERVTAVGGTAAGAGLSLAVKWAAGVAVLTAAAVLLGRGLGGAPSEPAAASRPAPAAGAGSLSADLAGPEASEEVLAAVGEPAAPRTPAADVLPRLRVVDADGAQPAGLRAFWVDGSSGARVALVFDGEGWADRASARGGVLVAHAPGHFAAVRRVPGTAPGQAATTLTLRRARPTRVEVVEFISEEVPGQLDVVESDGQEIHVPARRSVDRPVPGASLQVTQTRPTDVAGSRAAERAVLACCERLGLREVQFARTGEDGRATVTPHFEGPAAVVTIEPLGCLLVDEPAELVSDGPLPFVTGVRFTPGLDELSIATLRGGVARGRLVRAGTDEPFDGTVSFASTSLNGDDSMAYRPVFPGPDGTFELPTEEVFRSDDSTSHLPVSSAHIHASDGEGILATFTVHPRAGADLGVLEVPSRRRVRLRVTDQAAAPLTDAVATIRTWGGKADGSGVIDAPWFPGGAIGVAAPGHDPRFVEVDAAAFAGARTVERAVSLVPSEPLILTGLGRSGAAPGLQLDVECPSGLMAAPTLEVAGFGTLQPLLAEVGLRTDLARIEYPDMRSVGLRVWPRTGEVQVAIPGLRRGAPLTVTARDAVGVVLQRRLTQLPVEGEGVDLELRDLEVFTLEIDVRLADGGPAPSGHVVASVGKERRSFPFTDGRCSIPGVSRSREKVRLTCHVDVGGERRKAEGSAYPAAVQGPVTIQLGR